MQLQTGKDQNGNPVEPGTVDQNTSKITGLTDLFVHLSYLEHSTGIYAQIYSGGQYDPNQHAKTIEYIKSLLDTYPHMPPKMKQDIIAYWENPSETTMQPIKAHAADEVQRMWDILKMC